MFCPRTKPSAASEITRFDWEAWLHPGASFKWRGPWLASYRFQCIYNNKGVLITDGIAAGTQDFGDGFLAHRPIDVQLFNDAVIESGGNPLAPAITRYQRIYPTPGVILDALLAADHERANVVAEPKTEPAEKSKTGAPAGLSAYDRLRIDRFVPDNRFGMSGGVFGGPQAAKDGFSYAMRFELALRPIRHLPLIEIGARERWTPADTGFEFGGALLRIYPTALQVPTALPMEPQPFVGVGVSRFGKLPGYWAEVGVSYAATPWLWLSSRFEAMRESEVLSVSPQLGVVLNLPFLGP